MKKSFHYLFLLLITTTVCAKDLSTSVYGRLVCNGVPVVNVRLRLYDKSFFSDKLLYQSDTNQNGEFRLFGSVDTLFKFQPYVRLYHKCNYSGFCSKTIIFEVPDSYITRDSIPAVTYNVGVLNLNNPTQNQSLVCTTGINTR